jgi:hypothetical protein
VKKRVWSWVSFKKALVGLRNKKAEEEISLAFFLKYFNINHSNQNINNKKKAASTSCLKAMKTIKQCSENRKLETIKSSLYLFP